MSIQAHFQLTRGDFTLDTAFFTPGSGITAVFGPSASGKTTLLRAMAGLEKRTRGFFQVNDATWQDPESFIPAHQRSIGYVFQEASLFTHQNVRKNLEYGFRRVPSEKRKIRFDEIVSLLELEHLLERNPDSLSGGERQRVAIGRALLTSPSLLLMDEPLAALDLASKSEIMPCLEKIHEHLNTPVFYVSHSPEEVARLADHILLMDNGKVCDQGPLEEILSKTDTLLSSRDDAFSILHCLVEEPMTQYHLTRLTLGKTALYVPHFESVIGQRVRLRIQARDISLCLDPPSRTSILNILPAEIIDLTAATEKGQRVVRLKIANEKILARISERSCNLLALRPGLIVHAQIKAVALLI